MSQQWNLDPERTENTQACLLAPTKPTTCSGYGTSRVEISHAATVVGVLRAVLASHLRHWYEGPVAVRVRDQVLCCLLERPYFASTVLVGVQYLHLIDAGVLIGQQHRGVLDHRSLRLCDH